MARIELPAHVAIPRRDGRREVLLHRSMAVIDDDRVEIRAARSTLLLPIVGIVLVLACGAWIVQTGGTLPFWLMVGLLLFCLVVTPLSVMGLVSSIAGAEVVVDARKGSATWQQGYLGMGIGTKELVPFAKIDHLEVTIEGDQPDRWRGETDALRQFALVLVKASGKRLRISNVPVRADDQTDGMDRTLAVAQAISAITGARVEIPEGWELVEVDVESGTPVPVPAPAPEKAPVTASQRRRPKRR